MTAARRSVEAEDNSTACPPILCPIASRVRPEGSGFRPRGDASDVLLDPVGHGVFVETDSPGLRKTSAPVIISNDTKPPFIKVFSESFIKSLYNGRRRVNDHQCFGFVSLPERGGDKAAPLTGMMTDSMSLALCGHTSLTWIYCSCCVRNQRMFLRRSQ